MSQAGIVFILDRPQDVVNVGAVVRLLGNFGLPHLRLIEPAAFDPERILAIARRGHDVLAATERFGSLDQALADCAFVLGTTSRERAQARPLLTPRQAAPVLLAVAALGAAPEGSEARPRRAAVLFGPENFGLSNAALDRCHAILRIPTVPHDASLNLGQAALLVAYELFLAADGEEKEDSDRAARHGVDALQGTGWFGANPAGMGAGAPHAARVASDELAVGAQLEAMFAALERLLLALHPQGIPGRTAAAMARLRALFLRGAPSAAEARLLTQVFEHAARELAAR